jgi:hypothetical protein
MESKVGISRWDGMNPITDLETTALGFWILRIERHFENEIKEGLDYVYRYR